MGEALPIHHLLLALPRKFSIAFPALQKIIVHAHAFGKPVSSMQLFAKE